MMFTQKTSPNVIVLNIDGHFWAPPSWQEALMNPENNKVTENMIDYVRRSNQGKFPALMIDEYPLKTMVKDKAFDAEYEIPCCLYLSGEFIDVPLSTVDQYQATIAFKGLIYSIPAIYFTRN